MKKVVLHKGRDGAVRRRNPWVFSGAIKTEEEGIADGELIAVEAANGDRLGCGHYQSGGIRVRVLHFGTEEPEFGEILRRQLRQALALRTQLGLTEDPLTNAYRLVHAAGDGLPGLIVDRYASVVVVQCHSVGMHLVKAEIAEALRELLGDGVETIYDKSASVLPERHPAEDGLLWGAEVTEVVILENGRRFRVDVA
ncbi:MAG: class I SAM-dependent rRNA methyltransferase, partial [Bacteroidota bacterium]